MQSKRVACYARVSTMDQSTGLESQVRVLKTYCEQNQIQSVEFFTDEGISGTKSSRPALDRMMAAVESDGISIVIVYSFSRFARSTTHLLNALGVAIFSILASISQLERDLIADRVKIGLANARAKGRLIGRKKLRDSDLIRKWQRERREEGNEKGRGRTECETGSPGGSGKTAPADGDHLS